MSDVARRASAGKDSGVSDSVKAAPGTVDLSARTDATRPNEHIFTARIELAGLSSEGKRACGSYIEQFATELASEASRVEESNRPADVDEPEITAAAISIAHRGIMQRQIIAAAYETQMRKKTWKDRGIEITATLGMAGAGAFANYLHAKWQVGLFTVLAVLAILSTVYIIGRQR